MANQERNHMWNNTQTRQWDQFFRLLEGKLTDRCLKLSLTEGGERAAPRIGTQEPVATTEKVMYAGVSTEVRN